MNILVDLDGTLVDTHSRLITHLNEVFDEDYTVEDIIDYTMEESLPEEHRKELFEFYESEDFYDYGLELFDQVVSILKRLKNDGHTIICISEPLEGHASSKNRFMHGLMEEKDYIDSYFLGKGRHNLNADCLIDDCPEKLEKFDGFGILVDRSYNKEYSCVNRLYDHNVVPLFHDLVYNKEVNHA